MSCDRPCGGCPWRAENQTPEAVAASPVHGGGGRWYDHGNLRRHWRAAGRGSLMPCHATDRNAPLYGGTRPSLKAQPRLCVGLAALAKREVTAFMVAGGDHRRYKSAGGSMTLLGLASWAARLLFPGATLSVDGQAFRIPVVDEDDETALCVPGGKS